MIGQESNKEIAKRWKDNNSIPRFIIITGEEGSGRTIFARYIAKVIIEGYIVMCENGVEAVREVIDSAYKNGVNTVYIFPNTDKMSTVAKNALLKVVEEPPSNSYFIMTMTDVNNTFATIKSRGTLIQMSPYTKEDLQNFSGNDEIIEIATNPGQVSQLAAIDFKQFLAFCESVLDNIGVVTGVNAFKIADKMKFKEDAEGYNPVLFFNTIMMICNFRILIMLERNDYYYILKYTDTLKVCSRFKRDMQNSSFKKDATFDCWLLAMRKIWVKEI